MQTLSPERMEHFSTYSPAIMYCCQATGNFPATFISSNVTRILGYQPTDFTNNSDFWVSNIHPEDLERIFNGLSTLFKNNTYYHEYRFRDSSGDYKWFRDDLTLVRNHAGDPIEIVGCMLELTNEKALVSLNSSHAALMEVATDGIHIHELQGNLLEWSTSFAAMLGYTQTELQGLNIRDLDTKLSEEEFSEVLAELANGPQIFETVLRRKDGVLIDVQINAKFIELNGKGCVFGSARDVTKLKLSERTLLKLKTSLEESQQRLILATTAGGVGIWDWDLINNILAWDEQMYVLYGLDKNQFTSAYDALQKGLHPDDRALADQASREAMRSGEFKAEFRIVRPDGSTRYIRGLARAIKNSDGEISRMIGTNWDITEQKLTEKKAEELAFFDYLTSLPNRRLFADRLQRAIKLSERSKQYCALLSIDVDHFKNTNDLYGHHSGDLVLQATAQHLLKAVRTGDTVARLGGDEFLILLEDLGLNPVEAGSAAKRVAEKILAIFNASDKLTASIPMNSLSIGVTSFTGGNINPDEMIKQSDVALYQAKKAGRNCMKFYDEEMQTLINARVTLESILHQAVEKEWFVLHYQPQLGSDQRIESAEALLRLNHPQRGLMSPGEFIDLAESTDLIIPIGWWVFDAACMQLVAWASHPKMAHLKLSVNISIKQFKQANVVSQIIDTVVKTGANPKLLTLELTETLFLEGKADAIQKMQALKDYGFNFSLDDFGTGYSSLSYLKSLPFDELKIDQTFIAEMPGNQVSNDIVRMIIILGQTLDLRVVAEGVESKEQLQYLKAMGCHHYQGYLFFHPMPLHEFVELMTH